VVDNTTVSFDALWSYWNFLAFSANNDIDEIKERVKFYNYLSDSVKKREDLKLWITFLKEHLNFEEVFTKSLSCSGELDNLDSLFKAIEEQKNLDIKNFSELGKPQNQVTISTRHSSKGLEFEVIILLGMEDERFPFYSDINDPKKLAESSRICFVCISRAKRVCILVRSKKHILNTRRGETWEKDFNQSRFWTILEDWQNSKKKF
jgi:DNA helicase-2/ATP-dependent DNA helicase PcrA